MKMTSAGLSALSACLLMAGAASADPITGTPSGPSIGTWTPAGAPASTNAANYATAGSDLQRPFVILAGKGIGELTLEFHNGYTGLTRFEIRIDGLQTGLTAHPVILGDTIEPGPTLSLPAQVFQQTFFATSTVEARLALGGERDWRFDWTSFSVLPRTQVPTPGPLALLALGLLGMAAGMRRQAR